MNVLRRLLAPLLPRLRAECRNGTARGFGARSRQRVPGRKFAMAAAGLALAGCQATSTEDVLNVAPQLPVPVQETMGAGPVMVAMLLPRRAAEPAAGRARDFAEGARLAVGDLGAGLLRVTVYDTAGNAESAAAMAQQAVAGGARLIIISPDAESAAGIAAIKPSGRPPAIALSGERGSAGLFAFTSDSIDSAIDGARAAIAMKQSRILAVVPEGFSASDRERFSNGVARNGGKLVGTVAYPPVDAQIGPALKAEQARFQQANAVAIFGTGRAPAAVAQAIVAQGLGGSIATLVGNSGWPREIHAVPVLDGVLLALPDPEGPKAIAARYQAATGRPLSTDAALAYDAVAIAAGLVRHGGAAGLTTKALTANSGFRGVTGLFRFAKDGSVERRYGIHRIESGKPVLLSDPRGF